MKPKKLAILFPFILFAATSMFVRSWIPMFYSSWTTLLAGCILSVIVVPKFMRTHWFACIAVYSVIVLLNWYLGDVFFAQFSLVANEIAIFFLFSSVTFYLFDSNDRRCFYYIYYIMLIMVGIAAVGSLVVNALIPGIVRIQNSIVADGNYSDILNYYRMGMSNYLLPHGLPVLIPPLILLIKRSKGLKWLRLSSMAFLVFTAILVYLSGSTTALLLSVVAFTTFVIGDKKRGINRFPIILAICTLPLLFITDLVPSIISLFSSETAEVYAFHIEDMASFSANQAEGDTSLRLSLYNIALDAFAQSPIWGGNGPVSGHSVILDRLGTLGLIGILPFGGILYFFYQFVVKHLEVVERSYFNISVLLGISMLLIKGIEDKEVWLMLLVVAPVVLYLSGRIESQKTRSGNETAFH